MEAKGSLKDKVPVLRGKIHVPVLGLSGLFLVLSLRNKCYLPFKLAYLVSLVCSVFNFSASIALHNRYWNGIDRNMFRRIDYAGIFLMIGGSGFPCSIHYMNNDLMVWFVLMHWSVIFFGVFSSLLFDFTSSPKPLRYTVYVSSALPYFYHVSMGIKSKYYLAVAFMFLTLGLYLLGMMFYAKRAPNLIPRVFEYHELFHLFCCFGFIACSVVNFLYWKKNSL